jgi:acetyl esterase/lipase
MPTINWAVATANKLAVLKIIAVASSRSLSSILSLILGRQPLSLRNAFARAWIGTMFEHLPAMLYSEPVGHDMKKIQGETFNAYLVPPMSPTSLKDADSVVIFYHGGGMILGHPLQYLTEYRRWASRAAKQGRKMVFVGVQYRKNSDDPERKHDPDN